MARRTASEATLPMAGAGTGKPVLRYVLACMLAALSIIAVMLVASRIEQFLISGSRFILPPATETGGANPNFVMQGLFYTADQQVIQTFARDFGRSIYLCPIAERRRMLLGIDWVKDATVSRIWPNKLMVQVTERTPVAFVQVAGAHGGTRFGLVDVDGVLLDPQRATKLNLPVLAGITAADTEETRRQRVKRLVRLQQELGPTLMEKISEIDVSDLEDVKVTQKFEKRAIVLMLGNHDFLSRMNNFLANYEQIRPRMQNASTLDLRLNDRIIVVGGPANAQ